MHLQVAPLEEIDDGAGARDLEQPSAEIVILSAADSELAGLARAVDGWPPEAPSVALTNLLQLAHPMSVDLYVDLTLPAAQIVSGTATDCIVVAGPSGSEAAHFAGLHTPIGEAVGNAVYAAVSVDGALWRREQAPS